MWPFPVIATTSLHPAYNDPVLNTYLAGHSWSTASKSVDNHSGAGFIPRTRCNPTPMLHLLRDNSNHHPCWHSDKHVKVCEEVAATLNWPQSDHFHVRSVGLPLEQQVGGLSPKALQHVMSKRSVDQGHGPEHVLL